jgi:hypothetical protein
MLPFYVGGDKMRGFGKWFGYVVISTFVCYGLTFAGIFGLIIAVGMIIGTLLFLTQLFYGEVGKLHRSIQSVNKKINRCGEE